MAFKATDSQTFQVAFTHALSRARAASGVGRLRIRLPNPNLSELCQELRFILLIKILYLNWGQRSSLFLT